MTRDVAYYVARHDRRKAHRGQRLHRGTNTLEPLYRAAGKHFRAIYATTKEGR